jgi:glucose-6-phosphate 1-dehydrogenase
VRPGAAPDVGTAHALIPLSGLDGANPLPLYVRLIRDALIGDRSVFTRPDGLAGTGP